MRYTRLRNTSDLLSPRPIVSWVRKGHRHIRDNISKEDGGRRAKDKTGKWNKYA